MLFAVSLISFIPVRGLSAARTFYEETLGLEVTDESPIAITIRAGATMVHLTQVDEYRPQPFTIAGWEVADMDTTIDELTARGVAFARYAGLDQNERGGVSLKSALGPLRRPPDECLICVTDS